jgi:8-oxo-dGTP pyrophosphatase MutT (NUDIX family)
VTAAELRARLTQIATSPPEPSCEHGDDTSGAATRADQDAVGFVTRARPLKPAAVLVPVVMGETPGILLTKRTSHLAQHAGQISFPGGRIDPEDSGPEAAALREAWEEIGLSAESVEVLGRMRNYVTGTGYRITPILGLVPPDLKFKLSPHEVDAVFELPMPVVLDPDAPRRQRQHVQGTWREYWVWPHPDYFIWGATAAIMHHLAGKLRCASSK